MRIKKASLLLLVLSLTFILSSCGNMNAQAKEIKPEVSQVKSICELAVMDCYYHNVAKKDEKDAGGILLWKKDKHFWIEYSGIVKIGIDASLVDITVEEDIVTITIPEAKVLYDEVDEASLTKDSFFVDKDSIDVKGEDEKMAVSIAQENMVIAVKENTALLVSGQQRAKKLLEEYVMNIGDMTGKKYVIEWKYVDNELGAEATVEEPTDAEEKTEEE
jgi:hypothetical protein